MRRVAAIDQGTSSTKLAVLDEAGHIDLRLRHAHATFRPREGWVEQDPLELLANVRLCLDAAGDAAALGLANQGESCLAWDRVTGEPLSPVIGWQDRRAEDIVGTLARDGAEELTLARAGLPLDSYFSAPKLGWLLANEPDVARARREGRLRLGTTDAFFLDRLTGQFATDVATASRTCLLDIRAGAWDDELCALFDVPRECLPEIRPSVGAFGEVGGIPVAASIVDQQASLYGHGCRSPGETKVTFGTGAFVLAVTGRNVLAAPASGLLPTIAWAIGDDLTYALDGGVLDAGGAVDWAARIGLIRGPEDIAAFGAPPAIGRGLAFVPALSGLGAPHWDRVAGGLWIGMSGATSAADLCQALVEGVALRVAEILDAMAKAAGPALRVSVDGGLAGSDYLLQFLADMSGREVLRPDFHDVTCLGTALLAGVGIGLDVPPPAGGVARFAPRPCEADAWRERFADAVRRSRTWH